MSIICSTCAGVGAASNPVQADDEIAKGRAPQIQDMKDQLTKQLDVGLESWASKLQSKIAELDAALKKAER